VIASLNLVLVFAFQLPVCFIDEDQYSRSSEANVSMSLFSWGKNIHSIVKHEKFFPRILHDLVAKVSDKECNICWLSRLILRWQGKIILFLVGEQDLQAPAVED